MATAHDLTQEAALLLACLHEDIISRRRESSLKRASHTPIPLQAIIAIPDDDNEHNKQDRIVCLSCEESFTDEATHKIRHQTSITAKSSSSEEREEESGARPVVCDRCASSFSTTRGLTLHQRVQHGEHEYACDKCKYRTTHFARFQLHSKSHDKEGYVCERPGCSFKTGNVREYHRHNREHDVDPARGFVCRFDGCGYATQIQSNFKRHILKHSPENKTFKCSKCRFSTHLEAFLRMHENRHIGRKPIACTECPMTFVSASAMRHHLLTTHDDAETKRYRCTQCTYQTDRTNRLRDHLRLHNNSLQLNCQHCQFNTQSKTSLKVHVSKFHSEEEAQQSRVISIDSSSSYNLSDSEQCLVF